MGIIQNTQKKLTMPSKAELETIVKKAFELYDTDKSGFLEREEIKKLLNDACAELGAPAITDAQLDEVIKMLTTTVTENSHSTSFSRSLDQSLNNNWLKRQTLSYGRRRGFKFCSKSFIRKDLNLILRYDVLLINFTVLF